MKSEETKGRRILSGEFIADCRKGFSELALRPSITAISKRPKRS
jgi:hypothetical protein